MSNPHSGSATATDNVGPWKRFNAPAMASPLTLDAFPPTESIVLRKRYEQALKAPPLLKQGNLPYASCPSRNGPVTLTNKEVIWWASNHGFAYFPYLPQELRDLIYEIPLNDYLHSMFFGKNMIHASSFVEDYDTSERNLILQVDPVGTAIPDAWPVCFTKTVFAVDFPWPDNFARMIEFIGSVPRGLESIRELHFNDLTSPLSYHIPHLLALPPEFPALTWKAYLDLGKRCSGLKTVYLKSSCLKSFCQELWDETMAMTDEEVVDVVVGELDLCALFECRKLRMVHFEIVRGRRCDLVGHPERVRCLDWRLGKLMDWIRDEFKRRNEQLVEVKVTYLDF